MASRWRPARGLAEESRGREQEAVDAQKAAKAKEVTDATDPFDPLKGKSNRFSKMAGQKKKQVAQPEDTPEPNPR